MAVPLPTRGMASPAPARNRLPLVVPADCGAKVTFNVTLWPAASLIGYLPPAARQSASVVCRAQKVPSQERAFVITTGTVVLVPNATWPNDTVEGLAVTASLARPVPTTRRRRGTFADLAND